MTAQVVSKLSQFLRTGLKEGATIAGERIEKEALRAGVKPEELDFAKLPVDPNKRYTQSELRALDRERDDIIGDHLQAPRGTGIADGPVDYTDVVLNRVHGSPNYRERVTQFSKSSDLVKQRVAREELPKYWELYKSARSYDEREAIRNEAYNKGIPGRVFTAPTVDDAIAKFEDDAMYGRFMSEHFGGAPNYLMHTRYTDDALQGKSTRMLMEIQSDLHQGERVGDVTGLDASPWKDSWLRKGIERELVDAHNKGVEQVAIPISNVQSGLSPEVKAMGAELQARIAEWQDAARSVPERLNAEVEVGNVTDRIATALKLTDAQAADLQDALYSGRTDFERVLTNITGKLDPLHRGEGVQKWYETEVLNTAKKIAKVTGSEFEEVTDDGVKYAVIRPTKDFTVPLYSSPVAAYFGVRMALDKGYSEEEIRAYAKDKGINADKAISAAAKIEAARKAGYSEEEIKAYLAKQEL